MFFELLTQLILLAYHQKLQKVKLKREKYSGFKSFEYYQHFPGQKSKKLRKNRYFRAHLYQGPGNSYFDTKIIGMHLFKRISTMYVVKKVFRKN